MEEKWFSVAELSNYANVSESTARRHLNKFTKYFQYKKRSKGKKYHPSSVFILEKISTLYADGYDPEEIEKILFDEFGFPVEDKQSADELIFSVQFERFKKQQYEFNKLLIQKLDEQQKFIHKHLEKRDKELLRELNEIRDLIESQN